MTAIIGVRRAGETRISFVTASDPVVVGQHVIVDDPTGTFAATVAMAADHLTTAMPPVAVFGSVRALEASDIAQPAMRSMEDERYRARKTRFPALGERVAQGVVIRIDMRHETIDIRDDRGETATIGLAQPEESEGA